MTAARKRSKKDLPTGPGMPAVLGIMTIIVLLVGGWILAGGGGTAGSFLRFVSERVGSNEAVVGPPSTPTPIARPTLPIPIEPTIVMPQPTPIQRDEEIEQLQTRVQELESALSEKNAENERLQVEMDNLKASVKMLRAELQLKNKSN